MDSHERTNAGHPRSLPALRSGEKGSYYANLKCVETKIRMSLGDGPAQIPFESSQREEQNVQQQRQVKPPQALHAEARHRDREAHL